jgi:PWI domain-containing protein
MVQLQVTIDPNSLKYIESHKENHADDPGAEPRLQAAREAVKQVLDELAHPKKATATDRDGDATMGNNGGDVEVVNIPLAQDDELADIPAEMREVVAAEIASFRDRSIRRDMERLKREEEMEEQERNRNAPPRRSRLDTPPPESTPSGPRVPNAPAGPRGGGDGRGPVPFVNGGVYTADISLSREDEESSADDEELHQRQINKKKAEDDKRYHDAEHKWHNRERARQAALERERDREQQEEESFERRRAEQLDREKAWDDDRERDRKSHLYYRDHATWVRKRQQERAEEASRDEQDRQAEQAEALREQAEMKRARGIADSFLDRQAHEMEQRQQTAAAASAPAAPFKLSLGAAAQRAQASRTGPARRTMAEVEGLLDDEEQDGATKRQLIPIQFEPTTAADKMTEEELSNAVRALAQEIPSDKDGLWGWSVAWDHLDDSVIREKLRPFVEKKIVEYLGVQEELLVEVLEEHLRKHGKPDALVEELTGVCFRPSLSLKDCLLTLRVGARRRGGGHGQEALADGHLLHGEREARVCGVIGTGGRVVARRIRRLYTIVTRECRRLEVKKTLEDSFMSVMLSGGEEAGDVMLGSAAHGSYSSRPSPSSVVPRPGLK